MKLISELSESVQILTEAKEDGSKKMYIAGPFLMFDKANRNGRVYPQKVMDEAVKKYQKEYIDQNRSIGEFNHPSPNRLTVDPERACIMTTELSKDGNYYYGKAKVLSTPLGKLLENLLSDGVKMGVSSRGAGSLSPTKVVGKDYTIVCAADTVSDPSVASAFVDHLMEEKEYVLIEGSFVEKDMFEAKDRIKKATSMQLEQAKIQEFQKFLNKISTK
jgi:hypothetical protein